KLVSFEGMRLRRRELEEVPRIECVVPEKLVGLATKLIRARASDQIDDRSRHVSVLRTERGVVDLELLDAGDRRWKADGSERQVVGRDAIDDVPDGFLAIARRVEGERPGPANRRRRKACLGGRHRAWHKRSEIDEVAAIERNFMNRLRRYHIADRTRCPIEKRQLRLDQNGLTLAANIQPEVAHQRAADLEGQLFD